MMYSCIYISRCLFMFIFVHFSIDILTWSGITLIEGIIMLVELCTTNSNKYTQFNHHFLAILLYKLYTFFGSLRLPSLTQMK